MKRYLQNIEIECWRHAGRLGTSEPSICLFQHTADLGRPILQALDEMRDEAPTSRRKLTIKPSPREHCITTLRLQLVPERDDVRVMNISCRAGTATIEMTSLGLPLVRDAVSVWCNGGEDFCVSPESAALNKRDLGAADLSSGALWFWGPSYYGP